MKPILVALFCRALLNILVLVMPISMHAQQDLKGELSGMVADKVTQAPLPFTYVSLYAAADSSFNYGIAADENGYFKFTGLERKGYFISTHFVGYRPESIFVDLSVIESFDLGKVQLTEDEQQLDVFILEAETVTGRSGRDRTVYGISEKVVKASHSGTDILRFIPGIHLDLFQNITVEGSSEILVLVDGVERDKSFLQQLDPKNIQGVEVFATPPPRFEGRAQKVINVIQRKVTGDLWGGHAYVDIPSRKREIYAFPSGRLDFHKGDVHIYGAYNGEFAYFDVTEEVMREYRSSMALQNKQTVRQENWSHQYHFGADYQLSEVTQIGYYGYARFYSQELNGDVRVMRYGADTIHWDTERVEDDRQWVLFNSLYFKTTLGKPNHELRGEFGISQLNGRSSTQFVDANESIGIENILSPSQQVASLRLDHQLPMGKFFRFSSGVQMKQTDLADLRVPGFEYMNSLFAPYGGVSYEQGDWDAELSFRGEFATLALEQMYDEKVTNLLPNLSWSYKLSNQKSIKGNVRRYVLYPMLYHLNPNSIIQDPYTRSSGNPFLKPSKGTELALEYGGLFGDQWISFRSYLMRRASVFAPVASLQGADQVFVTMENGGTLSEFGLQVNTSLNLSGIFTMQGYVKGIYISAIDAPKISALSSAGQRGFGFDVTLSVAGTFGKGFAFSSGLNYTSPILEIQQKRLTAPMYFLGVDKTFGRLKAGMSLPLFFAKRYMYRGNRVLATQFSEESQGLIHLPTIPFLFKVSFRFGSSRPNTESVAADDADVVPRKGFK